jgi:hypothetical protein
MSDQYDIEKLIAASKGELPPGVAGGGIPDLGKQVPVMHGIPVNNKLMTIHDLVELSEGEFRELFLASIISLAGGIYMPPPDPTPAPEEASELDSEPN